MRAQSFYIFDILHSRLNAEQCSKPTYPGVPEMFQVIDKSTGFEGRESKHHAVAIKLAGEMPVVFDTVLIAFILRKEMMAIKKIGARRFPKHPLYVGRFLSHGRAAGKEDGNTSFLQHSRGDRF